MSNKGNTKYPSPFLNPEKIFLYTEIIVKSGLQKQQTSQKHSNNCHYWLCQLNISN